MHEGWAIFNCSVMAMADAADSTIPPVLPTTDTKAVLTATTLCGMVNSFYLDTSMANWSRR